MALVLSSVLIGLLVAGCGRGKAKDATTATAQPAKPVTVITAKRASIAEELELTGSCQAMEQTDVTTEIAGKVMVVAKDVGQPVRRGEMLVALDRSLAARQREQADEAVNSSRAQLNRAVKGAELSGAETVIAVRQAEQGVASAKEQLRKAETSYKYSVDRTESDIQQAKVALASAQSQERDVSSGARSQEIAQAESSLRQAEADLSLKKSNHERYQKLYGQGAVSAATLDMYTTQHEVAQQSVRQAREALSLSKEGARQEQRHIATLGVDRAKEQLRLAEAGRKQVEMSSRDLSVARVGLRQAEESLRMARAGRKRYDVSLADVSAARAGVGQAAAGSALARTSEGKHTVYAPISGTVATKNLEVGEWAAPGDAIVRIVNLNPVRVDCEVSELDVSKIKVGDQGLTTIDGLPGRTFSGTVRDVAPQSRQGERNYIARVEIDNSEGLIRASMFARVRLTISQKDDVIVVPRDALVERGSDRTAYVVSNGTVSVRKVKIGLTNGREMEIVSGVRAGEQLAIAGQAMLADGEKVEPVAQGAGQQQPAEAAGAAPATPAEQPQPAPADQQTAAPPR
jgi:RND family efflux transporter MFP subunit